MSNLVYRLLALCARAECGATHYDRIAQTDVKETRAYLKNGRRKEAYALLLEAILHYPSHPVILSYSGWLQAINDRKYQSGLSACRRAFAHFNTSDPRTAELVYPVLHLNLGRALLAAGKKKEAVDNFNKGLQYDRANADLKKELKQLGSRRKPPVPFLSPSNPINKLVGMLLHSQSSKTH